MVSGVYQAKILNIHMPIGLRRSVGFVANTDHQRYVAQISLEQSAAMIAVAGRLVGQLFGILVQYG